MTNTKAVQERLLSLGYDLGPEGVDGILGRATTAAVAKFQMDRQLGVQWPGTIGPKTLAALNLDVAPSPSAVPSWIGEARRFLGLHERSDAKALDRALRLDASAIPWCGAFVGMVLATVLPGERLPANPLGARNWLKAGVAINGPQVGALAIFARGTDGWSGHVGFVVGHDKTHVHLLGGNQTDSVSIARVAKNRLLGYRWPATGGEPPAAALPLTTINASVTSNEA